MEGEFHSRGYLPHFDRPGSLQFLTWRLHDALDPVQWEEWRAIYRNPEERRELYRVVERHLDAGTGSALLARPVAARRVMETLLNEHADGARLIAAVVMPNHVHAVLALPDSPSLSEIVRRIKGRSARAVHLAVGGSGRLWQPDYFDRTIRSPEHLERCVQYVHWNPVKSGLAADPRWYPHSTAQETYAKILRGE